MVRGGMADSARQAARVGAVLGARTGPALRHGLADVQDGGKNADTVLPLVHVLFSNVKTWLNGTFHGVSAKHLPRYAREWNYRFNRCRRIANLTDFLLRRAATRPTITLPPARRRCSNQRSPACLNRIGGRLNLPRRNIFIWAAVILFLNHLFSIIKEFPPTSFEKIVSDLSAVGIFQFMAWYVILRLLGSSDLVPTARWRDFLVTTALCLLVFLPTSRMIWVAAVGIAIYLSIYNRGEPKLHAAGIVLAALSVQEFWGHIFFNLVAFPFLRAETAVVGTMIELVRAGTVWQDNIITGPSGYGIVIYTGCSSFQNLSLAILCWVTVTKLRHQNWRTHDFVIGGVIGGTMILLNLARLYLMAWDIDLFHYWHDGRGAQIFAISASLTILLISLYGSSSAKRLA
jgi:hypothetical protein